MNKNMIRAITILRKGGYSIVYHNGKMFTHNDNKYMKIIYYENRFSLVKMITMSEVRNLEEVEHQEYNKEYEASEGLLTSIGDLDLSLLSNTQIVFSQEEACDKELNIKTLCHYINAEGYRRCS